MRDDEVRWRLAALSAGLAMVSCAAAPDAAGSSAALESTVGPEIVVRDGFLDGRDYMRPAIACTSTTCLVAWQELHQSTSAEGSGIYAARIRVSDEALLDPTPFLVAAWPSPALTRVTASDDRFLVTFSYDTTVRPVNAFLVDESGAVFDTRLPSACPGNRSSQEVASDGESFLIAAQVPNYEECGYFGCFPRHEIHATKIAADGSIDEPCGTRLSVDLEDDHSPIVAWGGSEYLVFWASSTGSDVARVGADGSLLDRWNELFGPVTGLDYGESYEAIAGDGDGYMLLWSNAETLLASRLDAQGEEVDTTELIELEDDSRPWGARMVFDGSSFLAVWEGSPAAGSEVYASRISADGSEVEPASVVASDVGYFDVAAAGEGRAFLAYDPYFQIGTPRRVVVQSLHDADYGVGPDPGTGGGAGGGTGGGSLGCSGGPTSPMTCSAGSGTSAGAYGWMLAAIGAVVVRRLGRRRRASR